jgi:hypothetical protein
MFVQIPQVVDDGDILVVVYQVFSSKWLTILIAPSLQMIFQACDVVKQQGYLIRCGRSVCRLVKIKDPDVSVSDALNLWLDRRQLVCQFHSTKRSVHLL